MLDFDRFSHISFDCYGTLIDWESGILAALVPLMARHGIEIDPRRLLEAYAFAEASAEQPDPESGRAHRSYRQVLASTTDALGNRLGFVPAEEERGLLADSLPDWPAFEDSVEALRRLGAGHELVVLSNTDRDLFAATQERLDTSFSAVITAQDLEVYKPSLRFFEMAEERLGVPRTRWLHVAQSCYHDIAPAKALGWTTVHIDRRRGQEGTGATPARSAEPDLRCTSLLELADCMGA